jgi:hypothetical protein
MNLDYNPETKTITPHYNVGERFFSTIDYDLLQDLWSNYTKYGVTLDLGYWLTVVFDQEIEVLDLDKDPVENLTSLSAKFLF